MEDQEEVNEGDAPAAASPDMTTIRGKENKKKRSQEVTPRSDPTPQPRHAKSLGAKARNASGVLTAGENEGGGDGVEVTGGTEVGVAGGNEGVLVVTGGTEVGTSSGAAIDKGKSVVEESKRNNKTSN